MSFVLNLVLFFTVAHIWFMALAEDYSAVPIAHKDCPLIDDLNHIIMLPYPQDCGKYYSCLNGLAYLQQCPNNLQWSTLTYRCDYPEIAKCQTTLATTSKPFTTSSSKIEETIYQLHPFDCNKYYKCEAMSCPMGYYWNSVTQHCDFPHLTYCPYRLSGLQPAIQAKQISNITLLFEATDIKYQSYPNECDKFYQCQSVNCPLNYHWNSLEHHCTLPHLASCEVSSTTETSSPIPITAITAFTPPPTPTSAPTQPIVTSNATCNECSQLCEDSFHQYRPHPNDCHKFVQCNGLAFIHTCPDNLFWNAKLNTCDRYCVLN